jgi:hypothetical protein
MKTTLQEPPFAVAEMKGSVTEATRCVGRYWQKEAADLGYFWNVYVYSYQVQVTGVINEAGHVEPASLVIEFSENNGKTLAEAHVHHVFGDGNIRRTITVKAFDACKVK